MESKYKLNTLRHWYLGNYEWKGKNVLVAYGQFFNRLEIYEGMRGSTSIVQYAKINQEEKEYEIQTQHTLYHCSFDSCFFERQDESPYKLPDYEKVKAEYHKPVDKQNLTKDDMLLVVADYNAYFFERLIYQNDDGSAGNYRGYPHVGMFTDTYLIDGNPDLYNYDSSKENIDIRYYVRDCGFEFYSLDTAGKNLWIENRGDSTLHIDGCGAHIELKAGERVLAVLKVTR